MTQDTKKKKYKVKWFQDRLFQICLSNVDSQLWGKRKGEDWKSEKVHRKGSGYKSLVIERCMNPNFIQSTTRSRKK